MDGPGYRSEEDDDAQGERDPSGHDGSAGGGSSDPIDAAILGAADGDAHAADLLLQMVGVGDLLDDDVDVDVLAAALDGGDGAEPPLVETIPEASSG